MTTREGPGRRHGRAADPATAPPPLRWIEELINTRSLVFGTDELSAPAELADWLRARDLLPAEADATAADLDRAIRIREGLRALIATAAEPAPAGVDASALAELPELARALPLVLDVSAGPPRLVPGGPAAVGSVAAALARLLGVVADAASDGTWHRFKVCRNPGCRWAYYDHSRNRSRTWCSMETCGNQAKARAFRRRNP